MKLLEIIQRVQSLYSKGVQSDDTRLTNRHIYNKIISARAALLAKLKKYNEEFYQVIDCLSLEDKDCHIRCLKVTTCDIPKFDEETAMITSVDGYVRINRTTAEAYKYIMGNKWTNSRMWWFYSNNRISLINTKLMKGIRVKAIFEDPVAAEMFSCGNDTGNTNHCIDIDTIEFPVPDEYIDFIVQNAFNELIVSFSKAIEDLTNDSKDSLIQRSK